VHECRVLLVDISLQGDLSYLWIWSSDSVGGYYVCGVYPHLTSAKYTTRPIVSDFLWHKAVPLKVSLLASALLWTLVQQWIILSL